MVCQLRLSEQPGGKGDIRVELVTVNEAETDEMWSFAGDKSRQYWLVADNRP
jgi:hypothetical protein